MSSPKNDLGLVGLAVMGQNLALNVADHGFKIGVFNRTTTTMEKFVNEQPHDNLTGYPTLEAFVFSLKRPRKIVILVKAGEATDKVITTLTPHLEANDIIIDAGNADWRDTIRREQVLNEQGFKFIGSGVSGGEEGARFGPSLMPGGDPEAWKHLEPIWQAIAAKVDNKTGEALDPHASGDHVFGCSRYIGANGAGHFVKMVHNGIEYADMQMIVEVYDLMHRGLELSNTAIGEIFEQWNQGPLQSFLIEITGIILKTKDPKSDNDLVDMILDSAGQKGTGRWTAICGLDFGVPLSSISEAVFARAMSAKKEERIAAEAVIPAVTIDRSQVDVEQAIKELEAALYCSKIVAYAQGFQLFREAADVYGWTLNYGEIAQIWRGGCIIKAAFLQKITEAFNNQKDLVHLFLDPFFMDAIQKHQSSWRNIAALALQWGIPAPCITSAISYFDSYRTAKLPQNLLQAQRDYFGAHTFERIDSARGEFFHMRWHQEHKELVLS